MNKKKKQNVSVPKGNCLGRNSWWFQGMAQKAFSPSSQPHLLLFSRSVVSNSLQSHGCSTPGLPVLHHLLELAQTHVHWVSDAVQPSRPLLSPSPPAFNLSQHQGLFQWKDHFLSATDFLSRWYKDSHKAYWGEVPCLPFQTAPRSKSAMCKSRVSHPFYEGELQKGRFRARAE